MEPEEIRDEEGLKAWLESRPEEVRQREAVCIGMRAAARVFPIYGRHAHIVPEGGTTGGDDLPSLPVLRCLLTAGVAAVSPTPPVRAAGASAADAADPGATAPANAANAAANAAALSIAAGNAANAATLSADAAYSSAAAAVRAASSAATYLNSNAAANAANFVVWDQIRSDAVAANEGALPKGKPLWHEDRRSPWFVDANTAMRAIWDRDRPEIWNFWKRWWDGLVSGGPMDWALQEKVALIPDEVWKRGPVAVAEAIREIEGDLALARTDNAEELVPNPETGRLHLVPTSRLPDDTDRLARRAMERAAKVFGNAEDNQYRALMPDLAMLEDVAKDAETSPVEMFDACVSATRRLRVRIANGECPDGDQDALVQDYSARLVDTAADIVANDEKTQEVLTRRNAIKGNEALIAAREEILEAAKRLEAVVEGRLQVVLPADAEVATDPKADAEERKDASVRLSGRVLRIVKYIGGAAVAGGGVVVGGQQFIAACEKLAADPVIQHAVAVIMRWLGLG